MKRILMTIIFTSMALTQVAYAETQYVSDQLRITLRSGQGNQFAIIRALESGVKLEVIEQTDTGYTQVKLEDGTEGWVRSQYLIDEPIAKHKLLRAEAKLEKLSASLANLKAERNKLREENKSLSATKDELTGENKDISDRIKYLSEVAAKPQLELEKSNSALQQSNIELEKSLQRLDQENQVLRDRSQREWFIAGAGVLLGGMLLGLIFPKIRWKRKSAW